MLVFVLLLFGSLAGLAQAASVTLAWDRSLDAVQGYHLYVRVADAAYGTEPVKGDAIVAGDVVTQRVDGLAPGVPYFFVVTAFDARTESGYSNEVTYTPPPPPPAPESVAQPLPPSGPSDLQVGVGYVFTARGAASSTGDPVQYRFLWSDGTDSDWLPAGTIEANKSWDNPGTYTEVRVEARCAVHQSVVSPLSGPVAVTVAAAPAETVSQPSPPVGPAAVATMHAQPYAAAGSASSAGHPLQYRFLWGDGTLSAWLPVGVTSVAKSWSVPGTYEIRSEARCAQHTAVHSPPSPVSAVTVSAAPGETVSPPAPPAGPADGLAGLVYAYTTGNAAASSGDPVQYRIQWGDGTASSWVTPGANGDATAWKSWPAEGIYTVVAEARCALHPSLPVASGPAAVSIAGGASLLIADSFADGTAAGDPQWQTLSGRWLVGRDGTFTAGSTKVINRTVVRALPAFVDGRIATKVRLTARSLANGTGIIFALTDAQHYRYAIFTGSRVVIGQVGDTALEKAGPKASVARTFRADQWYQLRADVYPGGRVAVFLGRETRPVLTYRFADTVPGRIGCQAQKSVAHFDDFRAWDGRVLH